MAGGFGKSPEDAAAAGFAAGAFGGADGCFGKESPEDAGVHAFGRLGGGGAFAFLHSIQRHMENIVIIIPIKKSTPKKHKKKTFQV